MICCKRWQRESQGFFGGEVRQAQIGWRKLEAAITFAERSRRRGAAFRQEGRLSRRPAHGNQIAHIEQIHFAAGPAQRGVGIT